MQTKKIFILSDGTGETATQITKAALVQFESEDYSYTRYKNVRSEQQLVAICEEAKDEKALLIHTLVSPSLRSFLYQLCLDKKIQCIDVLGPLLKGLGLFFGHKPTEIAGLLHDVGEKYFKRIDAMEYTLAHDDGKDLAQIENADILLLGVSRTSKTPLSMYLSHQGYKVLNIPIILGFDLPSELSKVDSKRIFGLTIDPKSLQVIRENRLGRLGSIAVGDYAEIEKISEEVAYADAIFKKNKSWMIFDVTGKALEETASEIIKVLASRRLTPRGL